jgi:hypothetical protein
MESNMIATLLVLLLGTCSSACARTPAQSQSNEDRVLQAWLTCEECSDGELDAVVKLGSAAVPRLAEALRAGPPQLVLDETRKRLTATHQSMVDYARTHADAAVPMSERDYVDRHTENFIALYQKRAATGLGAIGGPDAKRELTDALARPMRPEVLAAIREALQRL